MQKLPSPEQIRYMEDHIRDTKVPGTIVVDSVCLALACLVVGLRFISRRIGKVKLEANDWLIVIALGLYLANAVACALAIRYGLGKHLITVTNPKALAITFIIAECTSPCSLLFVKLSLLSLYCRVFPLPWMQKLSTLVALVTATNVTVVVIVVTLQCVPIEALWNPVISGKCIDLYASFMTSVIMNLVTDVIVLTLPIRPVWGLVHISRSQKWQLSIIFALGGVDCIANFIRLFYIKRFNSVDPTWDNVEFGVITLAEGSIAIIASSLLACRPLLKYLQEKLVSKRKTTSQNVILGSGRKKRTEYRTPAVNPREDSADTDSGIDEEQRSYIPLE